MVAVSPGLIPGTGIGRGSGMVLSMEMKDAKSVEEGEFPQSFPFLLCFLWCCHKLVLHASPYGRGLMSVTDARKPKKNQVLKAFSVLSRGTISLKTRIASS